MPRGSDMGGFPAPGMPVMVPSDPQVKPYTPGDIWYVNAAGILTRLVNPNDSAKYLNATLPPTWTTPSSTGGAGWVTALDLDFTTQGSQTLSSNTTYNIGTNPATGTALVWTKANSAADSVSMAVTNGTGLVIQPIAASDYNGTSRTAPYLYFDVATLIPSYYVDTPLRVWMYISADSIAADGHFGGHFFDNFGTSSTGMQSVCYRGRSAGVKQYLSGVAFSAASLSTAPTITSPLDNTDRVFVQLTPNGRWNQASTSYSQAYSAGWPTLASLRPVSRGAAASASLAVATQDLVTGLPLKFGLVALRAGSATALSITIARIRVDYRNPN